uniref:KaiR1D-like protein n=1 Tax=Parasacculina yatsui TaxID=2836420 RepID=A0A8K1RBW4_9CRUS|nr:KaiR1D-like protein [Parasacculina yatsui]
MGEWFWSDTTSIGTSQPEPAANQFLVLGVFSKSLWLTTVATLIACGLLLRWCQFLSRLVALSIGSYHNQLASYVAYIQQSVRMFLAQGDDVTSNHTATRILMGFVYMCAITLMSIYSGNLTAFLSIQRYERPLDSLQQLADMNQVQPHVTYGQSHYYLLANATQGARATIWQRMLRCEDCVHAHYRTTSTDEFVTRIVMGQAVLFQSTRALLSRADSYLSRRGLQPSRELCPVRVAREPLRRDYYTLQLAPSNTALAHVFDTAIAQLRYTGVISKMFAQVAANKCHVHRSAVDTANDQAERTGALSLHLLQGAFYIWLVGTLAASVVLFLELIVAAVKARWQKHNCSNNSLGLNRIDSRMDNYAANRSTLSEGFTKRSFGENFSIWTGNGRTEKFSVNSLRY